MDPRLVAIGYTRPVEAPVTPPQEAPAAAPVAPMAAPVAPPAAPAAPRPAATPVAPPLPAPWLAKVAAPAPQVPLTPVLLRQTVLLRDGRRDRDGSCAVDASGVRISGTLAARYIAWPDLRSISVERGRVDIMSPNGLISMAVALDGVSEPDLAPLFARVLEEGRAGTLDPTGALHELTLGVDRVVESFADADDPVVPLVVSGFAVVAGIMLGAALPMVVVLAAHVQPTPLGTFAILPRVASFDPRVIVAAFASAVALAAAVGRLALGPAAETWARGTVRGWHHNAEGFEAAARRIAARLMLVPRLAAVVAAIALVTLVPSVFARTTLDGAGIHQASGLPFIGGERTWAQLADVNSIEVGFAERVEGFDTQLVFADGSTLSTRGQDLVGGSERAFYDFARAQAR